MFISPTGRSNRPHWHQFKDERERALSTEIQSTSKDYILNVNEQQFIDYLVDKYFLHELVIVEETEDIHPPKKKERETRDDQRRYFQSPVYYECSITYAYEGNSFLWDVAPTTSSIGGFRPEIKIFGQKITVIFTIDTQSAEVFNSQKISSLNWLKQCTGYINSDIKGYNSELPFRAENGFRAVKNEYLKENDFFQAINVKTNPDAPKSYSAPVIQKRQPISRPGVTKQSFKSEPRIDDTSYEQITDTTWRTGISMEQKPSLYIGKDEESIRDFFLTQLELSFQSGVASSETFNHSGRTDILLKNTDGSNLFVAECKIWKGEKVFMDTISQLLTYLSWGDSKTAAIFFVKNESLVKVIETAKNAVRKHKHYIKTLKSEDRRLRVQFQLPQDIHKSLEIDIQLFHLDK